MQAPLDSVSPTDITLGDKPPQVAATVPLRIVGVTSSKPGSLEPVIPPRVEVLQPVTALSVRAAISMTAPSLDFDLVVQDRRFEGTEVWPPGATVNVVPKAKAGLHLTSQDAKSAMLKHMGISTDLAAELERLNGQLATAGSDTGPGARPKVMLVPVPVGPGGVPELSPALLEQLTRWQQAAGSSNPGAGPAAPVRARPPRPDSPAVADPRERLQRQHDELKARAAEEAKAKSSNIRMSRKLEVLRERRAALKAKKRRILSRTTSAGGASDRPSKSARPHSDKPWAASDVSTKKPPTKPITGMAGLRRGFLL